MKIASRPVAGFSVKSVLTKLFLRSLNPLLAKS